MENVLSLKIIVLWMSVVFMIIVSFVFLFSDTRSKSYRGYALSGSMASLWGFGVSMFYFMPLEQALLWAKVLYFAGGMIAVTYFYFSIVYTERDWIIKYVFPLMGATQLALFMLYFSSDFILSGVYETNGIRGILYGPGRALFDICFYTPLIIALFWLLQKALRAKDDSRSLTLFMFFGTTFVLMSAGFTNIILPWFDNFLFFWWGPPLALIWVVSSSYGIIQHSLLRSGIFFLELFAGLFSVLFLIGSFSSISDWLRIGIFAGLIILIGALIRSGLNEVRQKEELKKVTAELQDLTQHLQERVDEQTKEIKRAYEVEKTARVKLEGVDKLKSEFISIAAHQLRTPLTGIRWALLSVMEDKNKTVAEKEGDLNNIHNATTSLIDIVQDLLNVSLIEGNEFGYSMTNGDIAKTAQEALDTSLVLIKNKKIDISFEDRLGEGRSFVFDHEKIIMVLKNIIGNAIDYTKEGGHIAISLSTENDHVLIAISDTGIGMTDEEKAHLFTKFYRSKGARLMETDRSGLGLYIVKEIINRHKGTITVTSRKGEGTRMEIRLPFVHTHGLV